MTTAETVTLSWSPDPKATHDAPAAPAAPTAPLVIPARLGSVRLIRELGKGGMGVVWLGHHEFLDREVAVKFLLATVADRDDPRFQVFLDGARAAAQVRHLGLTSVLHADIVENVPYLVMEYVRGPTLADVIERTGPLRVPAVLAVLERVADALDQLHEAGVLHRDIKPSNILVDVRGHAYLTDFGLACRISEKARVQTSGTPAYMAPEAFDGEISPRTDIYALAITAYYLLAGRAPYDGSISALREQHRSAKLPAEPLLQSAVPAAVVEILQRAAGADPRFRTKSCRKLLEGFREAAGKTVTATAGEDQLARLVPVVLGRSASPMTLAGSTPDAPQPLTPNPPIPPPEIVAEPVPCVKCGYELRGLPVVARCPECQHPIEHSLNRERLIFADPRWIVRLLRGLLLLAGTMVLAGLFVPFAAVVILKAPSHELGYAIWILLLAILALGGATYSYRLAATPESALPDVRSTFRPTTWRSLAVISLAGIGAAGANVWHAWQSASDHAAQSAWALITLWAVVIALAVFPTGLAGSFWTLFIRAPRSRARILDYAAVIILLVGATLSIMLAGYVTIARVRNFDIAAERPVVLFGYAVLYGGGASLLAMTMLALRMHGLRRRLVNVGQSRARNAGAERPPSSSYYQSLRGLATKKRASAPTPEISPPPPEEPPVAKTPR